jgi:hypothetical protein
MEFLACTILALQLTRDPAAKLIPIGNFSDLSEVTAEMFLFNLVTLEKCQNVD